MTRAPRTASTKLTIAAGLFTPGRSSTPLDTSTPKGCTCAIAAATFTALRPPASTSCVRRGHTPVTHRTAAARRSLEQDPGRERHRAAFAEYGKGFERCWQSQLCQ